MLISHLMPFVVIGLYLGSALASPPPILDAAALYDGSAGKPSVNPCADFYRFACGNWLEQTKIPADKTSVSHSATDLIDSIDKNLHDILVQLEQDGPPFPTSSSTHLSNVYSSCMKQQDASEAKKFLQDKIDQIQQIQSAWDLARVLAQLHLIGTNALFTYSSIQDAQDSQQVIGGLFQAGMALPEAYYYFDEDPKAIAIRNQYLVHLENIFQLLGDDGLESKKSAQAVLDFESDLALNAYSREQENDPLQTYHPIKGSELTNKFPNFNWGSYFTELSPNLGPSHIFPENINIHVPKFFSGLNRKLSNTSLPQLKKYLIWSLVRSIGFQLGAEFETELFNFWEKQLNGVQQMPPRWKICTRFIKKGLGPALAEVYVRTIQTQTIRSKAEDMIDQVKQSFLETLNEIAVGENAWFDQSTQKEAIQKLQAMKQKVGAPEKWISYSELQTDAHSFLLNTIKINQFEFKTELNKIGKPFLDAEIWDVMPWVVNAYYYFSNNEFVIPFGILQPPMFDLQASDGANFGPMGGGTIGHELMHGFDNNGKQMDARGNLRNWWSDDTQRKFEERSQCFINQANQYHIASLNMLVNGKLTLSENLADQGGVKLGYNALLKNIATKNKSSTLWLNQYNERQQFWIAYAQSWCTLSTDESLRVQMTTDEHPPAEFRVNGVLMNRPEFAQDFACSKGSAMAPINRCSLW